MTKMFEVLGRKEYKLDSDIGKFPRLVDSHTRIGIEIEVEGMRDIFNGNRFIFEDHFAARYWNLKEDHSLKDNGAEFVSRQPSLKDYQRGKQVTSGLFHLKQFFSEWENQVDTPRFSELTSVHLHIDITDLDTEALSRFILLSLLFEDVLFDSFSPERKENSFCRSVINDPDLLEWYVDFIQYLNSEDEFDRALAIKKLNSTYKYTAVNINPISTFGTIEFRFLSGTQDRKAIVRAINTLLSIKKYSINNLPTGPLYRQKHLRSIFGNTLKFLTFNSKEKLLANCVRIEEVLVQPGLERL